MNQVGTIIDGRYELLSVAGEGGMATVYKARHLELDDIVAIKILSPDPQDQQRQQRFLQEARLVAEIQHPNVCSVKTFGICEDGNLFIVMEYMSGKSLAAMVAESGGMEPETACGYFKQICAGLSAAHKLGIVHRDLKPSNIMVNDTQAKILDFGIARSTTQENQNLTRTGVIIGSPDYMSPEQCMAKPTDERSDIYSLGCLMYECIVGQPPFRSDSEYLTMSRHLSEEPPGNPKLSSYPQLETLIKHCLEKDPEKRFADVAKLAVALDSLQLAKATQTAPWSQKALATGLCLIALAGLAAGAKLWTSHQAKPVVPFSFVDVQSITGSWLDHNEQVSGRAQRTMFLRECIARQKSNPQKAYDVYRVYGLLCTKGDPSPQDIAEMEAFYQSSGGETSKAPGWQHNLRDVHAARAACMTRLNRLDDAVTEYRKALQYEHQNKETLDDFVLHRIIGLTLMEQKRYKDALKEFELMHTSKCAGDSPKRHLQAYYFEGTACMALNQLQDAREKLSKAETIVCQIDSSPTDLQPAETALALARMFRTLGSSGELGTAAVLVQRATMLRETYKPTPANVTGYVETCVFAADVLPSQWPANEVTEFYSECWARLCRMTLDQSPRIRFLEGAATAYSKCHDQKGLDWAQEQLDNMAPRTAADLACAKKIKELCKQ